MNTVSIVLLKHYRHRGGAEGGFGLGNFTSLGTYDPRKEYQTLRLERADEVVGHLGALKAPRMVLEQPVGQRCRLGDGVVDHLGRGLGVGVEAGDVVMHLDSFLVSTMNEV